MERPRSNSPSFASSCAFAFQILLNAKGEGREEAKCYHVGTVLTLVIIIVSIGAAWNILLSILMAVAMLRPRGWEMGQALRFRPAQPG